MEPNIIYRFSEPSKMDTAEFRSSCVVKCMSSDKTSIYVQISNDSEYPRWNFIGEYRNDISVEFIQQEVERVLKLKNY